MEIINTTDFELDGKVNVAIGKFDGIHKGHQKLIDVIKEKGKECKTAVFTFEPSPAAFFGNGTYRGLTTRDEKRHIFSKLGIDYLIEYPLNMVNASVSPEDFVKDILVGKMHTSLVVCGPDFTFGDKGKGDVTLLLELSKEYGFEVHVCDKVKSDDTEISSTVIRHEIEAGQMEKAAEHIGAYYSVTGIVTKGNQIGRTIGLPTVNLIPEEDKLLPPFGVYEALVSCPTGKYKGITNVGIKPTVTEEKKVVVETNIFDFEGDLYDQYITVNLIRMIRPEKKFGSVIELKEQIESDIKLIKEGHR